MYLCFVMLLIWAIFLAVNLLDIKVVTLESSVKKYKLWKMLKQQHLSKGQCDAFF